MPPSMAGLGDVPNWIPIWLVASAALMTWDAGYVLLRPWSMKGGPLFFLWQPYDLYRTVDLIYGDARWLEGDRFCEAQSVCNLLEVALQLLSAWLLLQKKNSSSTAKGILLAFTAQGYTLWKTSLYWLYDILAAGRHTAHNPLGTLIFVYVIPNGFWLVFPLLVQIRLGTVILQALHAFPGAKSA